MKPRFSLLRSLLVLMLLLVAGSPTLAQGPDEHPRAPQPADSPNPPEPAQASLADLNWLGPQWSGDWLDGEDAPFAFTRFDAAYSHKYNAIVFMGGRLADNTTDGSVWALSVQVGDYIDTGEDLVTPVSNYTINILEDDNGFGFYIFCGRNAAGDLVDVVQVYYPDTNTAVQLGPEDNYPGSGTCTSGLNAVYNNKVYVAGGYDQLTAPFNWGETWVFDPLAPAGSRWTQIPTANLNLPRAYIMSAVVDGKLYAIGGDHDTRNGEPCADNLCPEAIVEVLDLSDPAPTWDDAAATDLPENCSEGRAFGFDSYSQYMDQDGSHFAGRIVTTCGSWQYESERVYVYNTRTNQWSEFPSLNRVRRNQAAEFIPLAPYGVGLMMMWGGRSGADNAILSTPEAYIVGAWGCPVLLVDDDWDFDHIVGENNGGRPYYTSALNSLGYPTTVWDTVSQGTPSAAQLSDYDITVWFTGYDYKTPISPTEQTELINYLEGGGNLFMSSQEQEYAYPDSPIMTDYFKADIIVPDATLKEIEGNQYDPLFAGLGPYTLVRPDDLFAYWPAEAIFEGPYDDAVNALGGAHEPMIYSSPTLENSTRFDNGIFKTMYLAYPLEWVNTIDERAQILGTALRWMCPNPDAAFLPMLLR